MKTPVLTTIKGYTVQVYWDNRAGYFIAEIPEIPTCAADGATQVEALANLEETFAVLKEAYVEEAMPMPQPDPKLPISVQKLSALSSLVKISRLAKLAGISGQTLATKLKRGTEFNVGEAQKLARALNEYGWAMKYPSDSDGHHRDGSMKKEKTIPSPGYRGSARRQRATARIP